MKSRLSSAEGSNEANVRLVAAEQTIYDDTQHPSCVSLLVIPD
jgi:hypothetical protein